MLIDVLSCIFMLKSVFEVRHEKTCLLTIRRIFMRTKIIFEARQEKTC